MIDAIVVGAGLFGQIINKNLTRAGLNSVMLDCQKSASGSAPAACLMRPSWFNSLGKSAYEPALRTLDKLYGLEDIEFKVGPAKTKVHWCDPKEILAGKSLFAKVEEVGPGWVRTSRERFEARWVIVAAGVWSGELTRVPKLSGRAGAAFLWPGEKVEAPFIQPWAPYRQIVAFNRGDGLWVGDGTAMKPENFDGARRALSANRCARAVGLSADVPAAFGGYEILYGIRPYVPGAKPCFLNMQPGLITATGGAKNGTLAAGWAAHKIVEYVS